MRRLFSLPALAVAAASVALAGCDSTSVVEAGPSGPTVQFGISGVSASETDGTVSIPVTLSAAQSGTVTVDVFFAEAASAQDGDVVYGTDFTFGDDRSGLRVATATFAPGETETTVTAEVLDDGEIEAAENVFFALQNADGARVGTPREFTLTIGTRPISEIRTLPEGSVVTFEGTVSRRFGRNTFLQDGSAGFAVFAFEDTDFGMASIQPGDRIQIQGVISEFGQDGDTFGTGLQQIFVGNSTAEQTEFAIVGSGDIPEPQTVTVAQILADGEAYESELVRIEGLELQTNDVVFESSTTYTATDGTASIDFRVNGSSQSELGGAIVPQGPFTYEGVVGQFRGTYQLAPIQLIDIVTGG